MTFTDRFGRVITQGSDGKWCTPDRGVTVTVLFEAQARNIFDAMAPEGWVDPLTATTD